MRAPRLRGFPVLPGCLGLLAVAAACNWYPEPEWVYSPPPPVRDVRAKVAGVFLDAATLQPVTAELTVRARDANGQPVAGLVTIDGRSASTFSVQEGVLVFGVNGNAPLPFDVTLVVHAEGYLSSSAQVRVGGEGLSTFTSRLVSVANPPSGVFLVKQPAGTAGEDGRLEAETTLSTGDAGTGAPTVTVTLPAQARLVDLDGTPLRGALTATVASAGGTSAAALLAFPGGFEGTAPSLPGAAREPGVFHTLGFGAVEVRDAQGRRASHADRPAVFQQRLEAAAREGAGSELPFFTRDAFSGVWRNEGPAPVAEDESSGLVASGRAGRFGWWSFGRFQTLPALCGKPGRVSVTGNPNGLALSVEVGSPLGYRVRRNVGTEQFDLLPFPTVDSLQVLARLGGKEVGAVEIRSPCDTAITLPVTGLSEVPSVTLSVDLRRTCAQESSQFVGVPGVAVLMAPGGQTHFGGTDASGRTTVTGLASGETYRLMVLGFDGSRHGPAQWTASESSSTRTFESPVECVAVSGATGQSGG